MKLKYGYTIIVIVGSLSYTDGVCTTALPESIKRVNNCSVKEQWETIEAMRDRDGGIVYITANPKSAFRELLDDFIGTDGFIKETGRKIVHTKEHGDFCVNLFWNKTREDWLD